MQSVYDKYEQFQRQSQSQRDMVQIEQLNKQIKRLSEMKLKYQFDTNSPQRKELEHFIKVYKLAIKQIERMKMQFTKPSLVKERLAQIFANQSQQIPLNGIMEQNSDIRSSEIEIPTFKNSKHKENVIDTQNNDDDLGSPGLKKFFQKKQAQLMNRGVPTNFKSVLQPPENRSFTKSNNRSVSRQHVSSVSRSSASSFMKKNSKQSQLKKILEENKKIKQEYEQRLKRQIELNEFQKNLLKQEKNRYMLKIEQMQRQLQNLYRANYKLKQEVQIKEKQLESKTSFNEGVSMFKNIDEGIHGNMDKPHDYYQPYVMKTQHNDLKRLSNKHHQDFDMQSIQGKSVPNIASQPVGQSSIKSNKSISSHKKNKPPQDISIDILGNQLQKQLKQLQKQRSQSNHSQLSSKKWSRQYNPDKYQKNKFQKDQQKQEFLRILKQDDDEDFKPQNNFNSKPQSKAFLKKQNNVNLQQFQGHSIQIHEPPSDFRKVSYESQNDYYSRKSQQQSTIQYRPAPNYSFSKNSNHDYSLRSNLSNCDTFQMTQTYLNMSQNQQQSQTNKYIDSRTSTRNKVAFFKDSLILIKNETFQLAFKRSALVQTRDRVRMIFFIKNKTSYPLSVNFKYQYDAGYFKIKVNEKLQSVRPNGQARQDLQVYAYSTVDLNQVIDIMLEVNHEKYGLWMPILWIDLMDCEHFTIPSKNDEISIVPDRQFKNFQTAKTIMPLMFGGKDSTLVWAYLYGKSKFGPCYIKLIWQMNELRIQTNYKWIDLLAFVMHHVK